VKWREVRYWVNSLTIVQVQQVLNEITLSAREEEFINGMLAQAGTTCESLTACLSQEIRSERL
jgi:hypothetical protein